MASDNSFMFYEFEHICSSLNKDGILDLRSTGELAQFLENYMVQIQCLLHIISTCRQGDWEVFGEGLHRWQGEAETAKAGGILLQFCTLAKINLIFISKSRTSNRIDKVLLE